MQPPPAPPARPPQRKTDPLAIASFVLGVLWLYWFGSVLALAFGYLALRRTESTGAAGRGMATAGIAFGCLGVAMLVVTGIALLL